MLVENNVMSLNIVKEEIDATLSQAEVALDAYDENRRDSSKVSECIELFQQLKGTFDMLAMPGASLLCESMVKASEILEKQSEDDRDVTLDKISNAIVVLTRYLEYVQLTQGGLPELLFVSINELRQLVNEKPIAESYFFSIDLAPFDVDDIKSLKTTDNVEHPTRRMRHMYQVGLLGSFKEENLKTNFKMMARALERLNALYEESCGTQLLWVCNGVIDSLIEGEISLTKPRKLILGRIDRQVKHLLNQNDDELNHEAILDLVKDCLYIIALAEPNTDLIKQIQTHFSLDSYKLNERSIVQERELMIGPSASVIRTVSSALKEEITEIKDRLDVMARGESEEEGSGEVSELVAMSDELNKIAHTLVMLGLPTASKRLKLLVDDLSSEGGDFVQRISALADSLVFIEYAIIRLEKQNSPVITDEEAAEEDESSYLDMDSVFTSVVSECRKSIASVQKAIGDYIESSFNIEKMEGVSDELKSAWGATLFLDVVRTTNILGSSLSFINEKILQGGESPDQQMLDALADALASIDYYLESFEEKKPVGEGILDVAEESLDALGYSVAAA